MEIELYEAIERFSIQTVDGFLDDVSAIKLIEKKYGRTVAMEVWKKCGGQK